MKHTIYCLNLLITVAFFLSCQKEILTVGQERVSSDSFEAAIEQDADSRIYIDEYYNICWQKGDCVSAFMQSTAADCYQIEDAADGRTSGIFHLVPSGNNDSFNAGMAISQTVAFYPYSDVELRNSIVEGFHYDLIGFVLPSMQSFDSQHGISQHMLPMLSYSESLGEALTFKNLCGVLEVQLQGVAKIRSITLKGRNGERISGAATVSMNATDAPVLKIKDNASSEIILDCGETGVQLQEDIPTSFDIVLPPTVFEKGFDILIQDTQGKTMLKTTTKRKEIFRSRIMRMKSFTYAASEDLIPDNEIWYTTSDGAIIDLMDATSANYGANLISNLYSDMKGVMTFDGPVTKIAAHAFDEKENLTSLVLPRKILSIGDEAFDACHSLLNCNIPPLLTETSYCMFRFCYNLKNILLPQGLKKIGNFTFSHCQSLQEIKIPESVNNLSIGAFENCRSLTYVEVPEGIETIKMYVFEYCDNLTTVKLPSTITNLEPESFARSGISEIELPNSLKYIYEEAFCECKSLVSITLPENLLYIAAYAFADCVNLASIYSKADASPLGNEGMFEGTSPHLKIYVPKDYVYLYKESPYWSDYSDSIYGYDFKNL